jgi:hypothetical protein
MHETDLRIARAHLGIPGVVVCRMARISRSRLSEIERGHVQPTAEERHRLTETIDRLAKAKKAVTDVAAKVGWPL